MSTIKELKEQQKQLEKEIKNVTEISLQTKLKNKGIIPFRIFEINLNNKLLGYFFLIDVKDIRCTIMKVIDEEYENIYARICVKTMYIENLLKIANINIIQDCNSYKEACLKLFEIFVEKNENKFNNVAYTRPVKQL